MIINPVVVGIIGTLFVEMGIIIFKDYVLKKGIKDAPKNKTF